MLVHIVNSANKNFYKKYLDEMFAQREKLFYETMGWKTLPMIDGKEMDEMDFVEEVEYLLVLDKNGELVGHCRCNPTSKPHLLGTAMSQYVQRPFEVSHETWEFTRFAPVWQMSNPLKKQALAYLCAASLEWALLKGIKRLLGIGEAHLLALAGRLGWPTRLLGMPIEYEPGKEALAFEFTVTQNALASTRQYFGLDGAVTILLPPQPEKLVADPSQLSIIDAVMAINREPVEHKHAA